MREETEKMKETPKPKRHSVVSNIIYAFKPVVQRNPSFLPGFLFEIFLKVAVPILGSYASARVVAAASGRQPVLTVILSIGTIFLIYGLVNGLSSFFNQMNQMRYMEGRLAVFFPRAMQKWLSLSLSRMEDHAVRKKVEAAVEAIENNDVGFEDLMRDTIVFAADALGLLVYIGFFGFLDIRLMLLIILVGLATAFLSLVTEQYYRKAMKRYFELYGQKAYLDRTAANIVAGKDIRVFDLSPYLSKKFDKVTKDMTHARGMYLFVRFLCSDAAGVILAALRDLVCYLYLIGRMQAGMSVESFVFYLGLISGFAAWFTELGGCYAEFRIDSDMVDSYRDYQELKADMADAGKVPEEGFEKISIEFDHVSFAYPGMEEKKVLDDVSFSVSAGEKIALVGINGAGKSTLVKLMSGLYLPTSGAVRINGIDTKDMNRRELMAHEAAIFQQPYLTDYSIGENVTFSETYEEKKVLDVLKQAGLSEKAASLPDGIHTCLGKHVDEAGISLSGGEAQKLLLARALYRNPSLVLLDEPTAALDALAETAVYETYSENMKGRTAVFISHRLASTKFCDRILLLSGGRIAEEGTHEELMQKNGEYAALFNVQAKYYQEAAEEVRA